MAMNSNESPIIGGLQKIVDDNQEDIISPFNTEEADCLNNPQYIKQTIANTTAVTYDKMRKSIRSSAVWLIGWAVYSAMSSNVEWAIVLAAVAIMSLYLYDFPGMSLVFGILMLWAATWNILLGGEASWVVMGVIQVGFAIFSFIEYSKYKSILTTNKTNTQSNEPSSLSFSNHESHIAWFALAFGLLSLVGLCSYILLSIALYNQSAGSWVETVFSIIFDISFLGVPLGIAALFTGHRPKAAAMIGIVLGFFSVGLLILDVVLSSLG
jgi:hypothetical protein